MSHFEKWVTFGKMNHTCKNVPNSEKWFTLGKWVTLAKIGHTWKNKFYRAIVGHIWKNGSSLENGSHLKNWLTRK